MAETIYKIGNKILKIGGKLLTVHNDTQTYTKSYSGTASSYPSDANIDTAIELEPRTYHIDYEATFSLFQPNEYLNCRVQIYSDIIAPPYISGGVTFTYISEDTKTVTIQGSVDIDLTRYPNMKYLYLLRDPDNIMGTVVGTITATRHT